MEPVLVQTSNPRPGHLPVSTAAATIPAVIYQFLLHAEQHSPDACRQHRSSQSPCSGPRLACANVRRPKTKKSRPATAVFRRAVPTIWWPVPPAMHAIAQAMKQHCREVVHGMELLFAARSAAGQPQSTHSAEPRLEYCPFGHGDGTTVPGLHRYPAGHHPLHMLLAW